MTDIYSILAPYYDEWNAEIDYAAWADGLETFFARNAAGKVADVLDLGCGTGRMTVELARRGYDMIGVDRSPEMLDFARQAGEDAGAGISSRILLLEQEMTDFELYGTVDAVVSCLDTVNHLTNRSDLARCFSLVRNYLNPDGLFLFDVNSKRKFEQVYADKTYVFEAEGIYCVWENRYSRGVCDFGITLFKREGKGLYRRYEGVERERMYPLAALKRTLEETGFEWIGVYPAPYTGTLSGDEDRWYIAARAKKD